MQAMSYRRSENIISDHKPISATFSASTLKIDEHIKQAELLQAMAAWREKSSRIASMAVVISPEFLIIPNCSDHEEAPTVQIRLENPAQYAVEFNVKTPSWLTLIPSSALDPAVLNPASETVLSFTVEYNAARSIM